MSDTLNQARVSVLISTFNRGVMLEECLDSVLDQTLAPHQVVVIDDGSTDGTAERVKKYSSRVQYMRKGNGGKASALNAGMPLVTGDFVWFFDDDDVALPTSIADRVAVLLGNPTAGLVLARHYWGTTSANGRIEAQSETQWPDINQSNILLTMMRGCFTMLQATLIRTDCMRTVGPFREELLRSQDYDMLVRLVRRFPVASLLSDPHTSATCRREGTGYAAACGFKARARLGSIRCDPRKGTASRNDVRRVSRSSDSGSLD